MPTPPVVTSWVVIAIVPVAEMTTGIIIVNDIAVGVDEPTK